MQVFQDKYREYLVQILNGFHIYDALIIADSVPAFGERVRNDVNNRNLKSNWLESSCIEKC